MLAIELGFVCFALKIAKTNPFLLETHTDICVPPPISCLFFETGSL